MNLGKLNQKSRFTLVEMLIVIAILAILISLLSPALKRAVDSGNSLGCMNHQKAVMSIFMRYAEDYAGLIPATFVRSDTSNPKDLLPPGTSGHDGDFGTDRPWTNIGGFTGMSLIQGYEQGLPVIDWQKWNFDWAPLPNSPDRAKIGPWNKVFMCPSDLNPAHVPNPDGVLYNGNPWGEYSRKAISYGLNIAAWFGNGRLVPSQSGHLNPLRLSRIANPAETVLGADSSMGYELKNQIYFAGQPSDIKFQTSSYITPANNNYGERQWEGWGYSGHLILRHQNQMGFNAFYMDGHVSHFAFPDYPPSLVLIWNLKNLY